MSRGRASASLRRQRRRISRTRGGVAGGQRRPVGLALEDARDQVRHGLALERRAAREALEQHAAERPDVGAPVDRLAARLLGAHVGGGAEDHPGAVAPACRSWSATADEVAAGRPAPRRSWRARSRAPSPTPDGVIMTLPGLRSRCTTPRSCAASSAAAIWMPRRERLARRQRPAREALRERLALDELEHEVRRARRLLEPVDRGDVRVVERRERLRLALEARQALGVARRTRRAAP